MKQFKLFFACALMSLFSLGQVWADTPAAAGTTLFSEDFSSYAANAVPSGSVTTATGRVVYGDANVTYSCTNGDGTKPGATKIYAEALATGTSPEILVGKYGTGGSTGGTFSIAGIPSGGAQEITVSFKQNKQKLKVEVAGTGYTSAGVDAKPAAAGAVSFDITVADGAAATFDLTFSVYSSNVRVDDILVTVKTAGEGAGSPKTLSSIAVSGAPDKTSYYAGDEFDPAGLTVTGTYSDASTAPINSGITWGYNPSQTLALNQTSIGVTATVSEITSAEYNVTGLTVAAAPTVVSAIEDIEDGASYYIRGVRASGAVVEYLKFTDGTAGATISGTSASSTAEAIAITFNKVSDGVYQLVTPEGLYVQPGASNGKIALSTTETTCNLANTTKTWDSSDAIAISTVDGSSNTWIIQKNTSGTNFGGYKNTQYDVTLVLASAAATVAKPTISGDENFVTSTTVTLACSTTGAEIYYTTDGTDPKSGTIGTSFSLTETATVRAIAKLGSDWSAEATKTFTKIEALTTMDQIFAAATAAESTATDKYITFNNWVVSGVSTNGKNVFVTDGTKGFVVFDNGGSMGFAVGDVLSGTAACKVQLYKGAAELTLLTSTTEGLSVATGGSVTPEVKAISALGGINTGAPVTINSVQFDGEYLSDGANSIKPYNSLFAYEALENGKYYNVTGIYQQFGNTTKEILPRSAADIEELTLADPELSYSPASETIEVGDSWSAPTFNNEHGLTVSFSGDNDAVATVNTTTGEIALAGGTGTAVITASFAGNATYAAGNATYTITVNPASVSENVVILAVYDTKYYAMSTNNSSSVFTAIEVEYDGSQVTVNSAEDKAAIQWTKKTSGDNTTFQNTADKYMKSADGTSMSLQDAVCNWVWDATGEYYKIDGTARTFFYQNGTGFKNFAVSNFNKPGYSDKAEVIVIDPANIVISSKVSAELAYDPATLTITQGDVWSAPTLGYVVGFDGLAAITYASDNEAVATVTDAGVISLAGGTGTATITATFAGNANYLAGNATYAITVNAPAATPTGTTYTKVTSTAEITDGEYLIVYEGDATHEAMAFNGSLDNVDQALKAIAVTIVGDEIAGNTDLDAAVFTIDVTAGSLQSASGYYIGRTENSNGMEKSTTEAYVNTFAITDGAAVITGVGGCTLRYNYASDQLRFRYYKSGQQDIQLYKKEVVTPTPDYTEIRTGLTAGNYYTVCYPKAMTAIKGGTLWSFNGKDADFAYIVQEEAPFVAGRPYIIYATDTKLEAVVEGDDAAAGNHNGLHGTLVDMTNSDLLAAGATYMLKNNMLQPVGAGYLSANRAYVILSEISAPVPAPGKIIKTMPLQGQTVTGIDELNASDTPAKLMINGQLFILRGEKMYDAQGRLVK